MKGTVILALAATAQGALSLSQRKVAQANVVGKGIPTTINQGPFSPPKPQEDKAEKIRKAAMSKLEETEISLKGAEEANANAQVLAGLRQDVRSALRSVTDVNASYLSPRAVHRVVGTLLRSISESARGNLARARDDGRIKTLQKALAEAAGQSMEVEFYKNALNGTQGADANLPTNLFRMDEAVETKEVLNQAYARDRAQFNLAKARIGFGRSRDENMRKALETAQSAGVDEKALAPTKLHLKAIDDRVEAIDAIKAASNKKGIDALEEAIEKGYATGVNPFVLKMANSRLINLKKEEKRQEFKNQTAELRKQRTEEILELRRRQAESDQMLQDHAMQEKSRQHAETESIINQLIHSDTKEEATTKAE